MRAVDLDLRPLYHFVRIVERGSLSRAAASLSVGQPVLSRDIRRLEERHGVRLLHRNGRGVTPTAAGQTLFTEAQALLAGLGRIEDELAAGRTTLAGSVCIAVPPLFGRALTYRLVGELRARHPQVALRLTEGFTADVLDWLANGSVDVAILYNPPNIATLHGEHLVDDRLCLVAATGTLDRASGCEVPFRTLGELPMILPPLPHRLRILIDGAARQADVALRLVVEVTGTATMLDLVRGGLGCTILPETLVRDDGSAGRLGVWPLVEPRITPRLCMVTSMQRPTTPALLSVLALVRQHVPARSDNRSAEPRDTPSQG
jgi:LysR family transcriptional regulator, nitrogen assimilation regulatory protein